MSLFVLTRDPMLLETLGSCFTSPPEIHWTKAPHEVPNSGSLDDVVVWDWDSMLECGSDDSSTALLLEHPTLIICREQESIDQLERTYPLAVVIDHVALNSEVLELAILQAQISFGCAEKPEPVATLPELPASSRDQDLPSIDSLLVQKVLRQSLSQLFPILDSISETQRWLERWRTSSDSVDLAIPANLLHRQMNQLVQQTQQIADASRLADDRAVVRRDPIASSTWLHELFSDYPLLAQSIPTALPCLRIDEARAKGAIRAVLEHFSKETPLTQLHVAESGDHLLIELRTEETINEQSFGVLLDRWEQAAWPNWLNDTDFTLGLGLAREQLRSTSCDLSLLRDDCERFGVRIQLALDEPSSYLQGFRTQLHRRMTDSQIPIGAFLAQSDRSHELLDEATDELLRQRLGSCSLVIRRGERTWAILAPVGAEESGEFVQWIQQAWASLHQKQTQFMEANGLDCESLPMTLSVSTVGHLNLDDELEAWTELFQMALTAVGPFGNEPPVVLLSRAELPVMDGLTRRLAGTGCRITQVHEQGFCPEEWDGLEPRVVDLRSSDSRGWQHLEDLVRTGSLSRNVILLTDTLQKQNERLREFGHLFDTSFEGEEAMSTPPSLPTGHWM